MHHKCKLLEERKREEIRERHVTMSQQSERKSAVGHIYIPW